jgi:hypothetical protein
VALTKRGSRRIVVAGTEYRWRVRRKPTYSQGLCWSPLVYAVESADGDGPGQVLVVETGQSHPGNWMGVAGVSVTPRDVAAKIREGLTLGWKPSRPGSPFFLGAHPGHMSMGKAADQ